MSKVVAGFPGTGKSYLTRNGEYNTCDSDSSKFSWIVKDGVKVRNPLFVLEYIQHIKDMLKVHDIVFVSTHKEVLDALEANRLHHVIVYPDVSLKSEYMERYRRRGNDETFLELMEKNFENFVAQIEAREDTSEYAVMLKLLKDETMESVISHIMAFPE